jgi:hypothetical protein
VERLWMLEASAISSVLVIHTLVYFVRTELSSCFNSREAFFVLGTLTYIIFQSLRPAVGNV